MLAGEPENTSLWPIGVGLVFVAGYSGALLLGMFVPARGRTEQTDE